MIDIADTRKVMFAATGSGKGKTSIVSGLLWLLKEKGLDIHSFKCGPDYIDPKYHEAVLGIPSTNLDPFFAAEDLLRASFMDAAGSFNIIEACMGLYDGLGTTSLCSSYQVARALDCPIVLIVDASGMAYSIVAEIKGFLSMDESDLINGIFLNRISAGFYEKIKPVVEKECGLPVIGYLPRLKDLELKSRHLGLMTVEENQGLDKIAAAGKVLADTFDIGGFFNLAAMTGQETETNLKEERGLSSFAISFKDKKKIAIAYDDAFWFYYKDNLKCLEYAGAELIYFSPLQDVALPEGIDAIYIGGGYPENYLTELEANAAMKHAIKAFAAAGGHIFAECGGFMYLCKAILDEEGGCPHDMVGIFEETAENKGKLVRFGYVDVLLGGQAIKGHEFHHYDVTNPGDEAVVTKASAGVQYGAFRSYKNVLAGFPHLYFFSNPDFIIDFFDKDSQS